MVEGPDGSLVAVVAAQCRPVAGLDEGVLLAGGYCRPECCSWSHRQGPSTISVTSRSSSPEISGLARIVGSDVAGRTGGVGAEKLVEQFLASWSGRTRQAYATSLEEFARFRGKRRADAVAELLASREAGRGLVLDFAVELRRRGRAWATVRSRLSTLRSLVRLAGELGRVGWSPGGPSAEARAMEP